MGEWALSTPSGLMPSQPMTTICSTPGNGAAVMLPHRANPAKTKAMETTFGIAFQGGECFGCPKEKTGRSRKCRARSETIILQFLDAVEAGCATDGVRGGVTGGDGANVLPGARIQSCPLLELE